MCVSNFIQRAGSVLSSDHYQEKPAIQLCSFSPNYWQMLPASLMKAHSIIPDDCTWSAFCPLLSKFSQVTNSNWTRESHRHIVLRNHKVKLQVYSAFRLVQATCCLITNCDLKLQSATDMK